MNTRTVFPYIVTMVITGMIIYILMRQAGPACQCDCDKMQQRIDQLEEQQRRSSLCPGTIEGQSNVKQYLSDLHPVVLQMAIMIPLYIIVFGSYFLISEIIRNRRLARIKAEEEELRRRMWVNDWIRGVKENNPPPKVTSLTVSGMMTPAVKICPYCKTENECYIEYCVGCKIQFDDETS